MDIVIPFHPKDRESVAKCVISCRVFVKSCRTIYLISKEDPNIKDTVWIPEESPAIGFKYADIAPRVREDRIGWYLQQLLKLHADILIPSISEHFLIVDSDVVFRRPVTMFSHDGKPCYAYGREYYKPYFECMSRLIPGLNRQFEDKSGICHHMIFTRKYLEEIRALLGGKEIAWKTIMDVINPTELSGFSEYELYFNYMIKNHMSEIVIRQLQWKDAPREHSSDKMFDYVAYHSWMRR